MSGVVTFYAEIQRTPKLGSAWDPSLAVVVAGAALYTPTPHVLSCRDWSFHVKPVISLLNSVINLLATEPYVIVIVISLDFSKAFDTLRYSTLLHKLAQLQLPDHIYNWLNDIFSNHSHCTIFDNQQSSLLDITASIIHGSAIGPAAYVVNAEISPQLFPETLYVNLPMTLI